MGSCGISLLVCLDIASTLKKKTLLVLSLNHSLDIELLSLHNVMESLIPESLFTLTVM